ncbi:major capsid protein [Treponema phagedenis]|uniref:major capsid protein n=1 Tax=Treponema phagedenis TaxID=162 RepID=UPI0011E773B3|nr:major capsid protein [Treponema phagedenis]QEK09907.1 major capsid protein E [Treponema phagedenis]
MIKTQLTGALNAFFNLKNFTDVVSGLPKPQTPMTDLLFPAASRKQKTSPYIAVADIQNVTGAVPVVLRGTKSYAVGGDKKSLGMIEVQPLSMNRFISGAELNNLIAMGDVENINAKLTEVIENLRDRTAVSTEILVCQSLSGRIAYPASIEGGADDIYQVEIGKLKELSAAALTATAKLADVQKELESQFVEQQKTGASADVVFLVGSDVYSKIIDIIAKVTSNVPVQWTETGCTLFGKYKLMPMSGTYALPGQTATTPIVDAKSIQTIDLKNTGKLFYAALDELDAKLQPLPFFASYEEITDPSGIKVLSSSKPLPAFAVSKSTIKKYLK